MNDGEMATVAVLVLTLRGILHTLEEECDIEDGSCGPRPNDAMRYLNEHQARMDAAIEEGEELLAGEAPDEEVKAKRDKALEPLWAALRKLDTPGETPQPKENER